MGLERRKRSGNLIGGSRLVVPGQDIYNVKKFQPSFNKKGSKRDEFFVPPPVTTTTTTIIPVQTCNIETQQNFQIITQGFDNLIWC
jgi:hypothetical protein